ncbi:hypothetical protein JKG47_07995 [Acidithiobacillus sp. MC6.1]|nr:hypothetical protein [Acidithiobacillus sp. MC6.1]
MKRLQIEMNDQNATDAATLVLQHLGRVGHVCPFLSKLSVPGVFLAIPSWLRLCAFASHVRKPVYLPG